jgi:hypothetical protein
MGGLFHMSEVPLYTSGALTIASIRVRAPTFVERRGNTLKGLKTFSVEAKARIWP